MSSQHDPLNGTDRLPAELIVQILDNTKDDTQTLHTCCLVCVGWHCYLIDSLYETICLRSRSQLFRLVRAVRIYPAVRHRIASARTLVLWPYRSRSVGFVDVFPLVLGPYLHKLEHLSFRDCIWHLLHDSFFGLLPRFKGVKHLQSITSSLRSFADFRRIVCAFPQLEELDIDDFEETSRKFSHPTPPHLPCVPKLTRVRIDNPPPDLLRELVAWLSSSSVCSTTRRLDIYPNYLHAKGAEPSFNALLAHTASTLEHLHMCISMKISDNHWGFPRFLHLHALDITHRYWMDPMSTKDIQLVFHSILASLTTPVLENMRLELHVHSFTRTSSTQDMDSRDASTVADCSQYADLHAVLARFIFSLHRATIVLFDFNPAQLMSAKDVALERLDLLRALFAPWCERGITNLTCIATTESTSWELVVDKGDGPRFLDLRGPPYELETALRVPGLDP